MMVKVTGEIYLITERQIEESNGVYIGKEKAKFPSCALP
jgi:hypothetical protein